MLEPKAAVSASRQGLILWFTQILPTLLPFSILSYVVLASGILPEKLGKGYIILCGFLFGFPIGCKLSCDFYRHHLLNKKEAEILSCFTNNLSPVFVTAVMADMLKFPVHLPFYLLLYGIPLVIGLLLLNISQNTKVSPQKETASGFHMNMQILDAGILNGFETLIRICGYIMLFSILCGILSCIPCLTPTIRMFLTGCMEVTNGVSVLSTISCRAKIKYLLAVFFLSLNGICGLFQSASVLKDADLSVLFYVKLKLLLVLLTTGTAAILLFLGSILV